VVSANLQHGVPTPVGPPDLGRALAPLADLAGDVYGFQELDREMSRSGRQQQPEVLAEHLGGELVWAPALQRGRGRYGIALVVRGTVGESRAIELPGGGEPRRLVVAQVEVADHRWTVATTHLSNRDRSQAERQLLACVDELARWPGPHVLVGDLNLTTERVLPHSTAEGYRLVTGPPTIDARTRVDRRIDHVLVRGARVTDAGVARLPVSDHLAVWADLI
jgi:endonuclease/exonuclease/phosphatase family metal-dependent hydrolase